MEFSKRRLEKILEPYINDNLECDGQSKVISYILTKNGIDHKLYDGELVDKESGEGIYHQWIEIDNNLIVDYKARMWYPDSDCWHGIFEKSKMNNRDLEYAQPKSMGTPKISDMIFNILCSEGKTMKLVNVAKKILNENMNFDKAFWIGSIQNSGNDIHHYCIYFKYIQRFAR